MKIGYLILSKHFFDKGMTGSTSHAFGLLSGFSQLAEEVTLFKYHKDNVETLKYEHRIIDYASVAKVFRWLRHNPLDRLFVRYRAKSVLAIALLGIYCRILNIPLTVEINTFHGHYLSNRLSWLRYLESIALISANTIYVVSPGLMSDKAIKKIHKNVIFVPNGHSLRKDVDSSLMDLPNNKPELKYFGSIKHYYNFEVLYEFISLEKVTLKIYGNSINSISSDFLMNMGKYRNEKMLSLIDPTNDILILPYKKGSIADYGFPTKLSEYLYSGALIISSNTGVLYSLLSPINSKLLYEDSSLESLRSVWKYALGMSIEERRATIDGYMDLASRLRWNNLVKYLVDDRSFE